MSNLYQLFKTDKNLEIEGVNFCLGEVSFRIKRFGGANASKLKQSFARHYKPFARQVELGLLPPEQEKQIMVRIFVESCLMSWENVKDKEGKPLEYTQENAISLFLDLPELFDTLLNYASEVNSFKEELGNS